MKCNQLHVHHRITVKRLVEVNKTYSIFTVTNNLGFRLQAITVTDITLETNTHTKKKCIFCIQWVKLMFSLHVLFIQISFQ